MLVPDIFDGQYIWLNERKLIRMFCYRSQCWQQWGSRSQGKATSSMVSCQYMWLFSMKQQLNLFCEFFSASTKTECGTSPNWDEPSKGCQDRLQLLAVGVGPGTDAAGLVSGSDGRKEGADVGRRAPAPPHAPPLLDLPLKRRSCSCRQPPQCSVLGGKKCAACRSAVQNRPRHSNATLLWIRQFCRHDQ